MKINLGRCISPRWYIGSQNPTDDFGITEDVFINILEKKILIKLQDENNNITWQEILHNIPVLTPEEDMENENLLPIKSLPLFSDIITDFEIDIDNKIEYISNPEINKWYKNLLIGFDDELQEDIRANIYFIEDNSDEDLIIQQINKINYKIVGTTTNSSLNLIIDGDINANLSSIDNLEIFGYAKNFVIAKLQENKVISGIIINFENLWINDNWKNNHNFILQPKELKIYNNHYRLREYKYE